MRLSLAFLAALTACSVSCSLMTTNGPSSTLSASPSFTTSPSALNGSSNPCASVSRLSSATLHAHPSASTILVPASLAYECLKTVPIRDDIALAFIDYFNEYVQFQSTLAYLKNPPPGYLMPPVDILGGLNNISQRVSSGFYTNEYDFELDIAVLIGSAYDGHFVFLPTSSTIFGWFRQLSLVSISEDGLKLPKIYSYDDIKLTASNLTWTLSPVTAINGQEIVSFLTAPSLQDGRFQDLDALYNFQLFELATYVSGAEGLFYLNSVLYPGPGYNISFENGTTYYVENMANVISDLTGVRSGDDMFSRFFLPAPTSASGNRSTPTSSSSIGAPFSQPTGYPEPEIVNHGSNSIVGYYLDDSDAAVLSIISFEWPKLVGFQNLADQFLQQLKADGKKKLIIDLQGNDGGDALLAYDLFKQLFPAVTPWGASNMRDSEALQILGTQTPIDFPDVFETNTEYDYRANLMADNQNFSDFHEWFDGHQRYGGDDFTSVQRMPISGPFYPISDNFAISGYGDRSNVTVQPLAAENIIMLYDGQCSSTCGLFSEFMKTQGNVHSVVIGGRPLYSPMQAVGGAKGAENLVVTDINQAVSTIEQNATLAQLQQWNAFLPNSTPPLQLNPSDGVNYRNNLREGDASLTPLQFVYEAADCRLFYTQENMIKITSLWQRVYDVTWGNASCVAGSTGQKTALPGGNFTSASNGTQPTTPSSPTVFTSSAVETNIGASILVLMGAVAVAALMCQTSV